MYKPKQKLQNLLNLQSGGLFSKHAVNTIFRALLEPVAGQNPPCIIFTRLKNEEGLTGLIKRLEYCTNVNMVDTLSPGCLLKDDYIELEFVILNSARYNFAILWDYSFDKDKKYTNLYFVTNSSSVYKVYDILQENLKENYEKEFYTYRPERRENALFNEALRNVLKKMNDSIEEGEFAAEENLIIDYTQSEIEEKLKSITHEIKNQLSILDVYAKIIDKKYSINKEAGVIKKALSIIGLELNKLQNYETPTVKDILLQDIINESAGMFEEVLKQKNNKISVLSGQNFDIRVLADENRLLSVFNNLLKNADESTNNDTIEIKVSVENSFALIDITNHGAPINENDADFIFQKGFTTKKGGDGIGLYDCKNYLKDIKGSLELLASDDQKTIFRVKLPLVEY